MSGGKMFRKFWNSDALAEINLLLGFDRFEEDWFYRIKAGLCVLLLLLGLKWLLGDWLWDNDPLGGLSFLIACVGLCGLILIGFSDWDGFELWTRSCAAYLFGATAGALSVAALLVGHPAANIPEQAANYQRFQTLMEISFGVNGWQGARYDVRQRAEEMLKSNDCVFQDTRDSMDITYKLMAALYLRPEFSVFQRILFGKDQNPVNTCTSEIGELKRMQPDLLSGVH
jgi:hypothetical protein